MKWQELLDWVNDPKRTEEEHLGVCGGLGIMPSHHVQGRDLGPALVEFITQHPLDEEIPDPYGTPITSLMSR